MLQIPVLMYHNISTHTQHYLPRHNTESFYDITLNQFTEHMAYLYRKHYTTFSTDYIYSQDPTTKKQVMITFDDGYASTYYLAYPILKKYLFTSIVFVTTDWIGSPDYLDSFMIKQLSSGGVIIGSHGMTHRFLDKLTRKEIIKELEESALILQNITKKPVYHLSLPGGRMCADVLQSAKDLGYRSVFTSQPASMSSRSDVYVIPRFPIHKHTSLKTFINIITLNSTYIRQARAKYYFINMLKRITSTYIYETFKHKLFLIL